MPSQFKQFENGSYHSTVSTKKPSARITGTAYPKRSCNAKEPRKIQSRHIFSVPRRYTKNPPSDLVAHWNWWCNRSAALPKALHLSTDHPVAQSLRGYGCSCCSVQTLSKDHSPLVGFRSKQGDQ